MRRNTIIWFSMFIFILFFGHVEGADETKNISFGVKGGMNIATTTDGHVGGIVIESKTYTGFIFGVYIDYSINSNLSLQSGLLFTKKGFKLPEITRTDELGHPYGKFEPKQYFNYLEIPITASYNIPLSKEVKLSLYTGPSISFLLNSKINNDSFGSGSSDPDTYIDVSDSYKTIDWSGVFGFRINFLSFGKALFVESRYTYGLTDIFKEGKGGFEKKHKVFSFIVGTTLF